MPNTIFKVHHSFFSFLKGFSKVFICGGYDPSLNTCEIISLESSVTTCKNPPNFPLTVNAAIGGLGFKENPIICGGNQNGTPSKTCYSLQNNMWVSSVSMNSVRVDAAAVQLQDGKLLGTGGIDDSNNKLNSTEILTKEGWDSKIPNLPVAISYHCMVTVNTKTVMVIGGWKDNEAIGQTFYFTFGEESWTEGPELKYNRGYHSCGRIRRDNSSQVMSIIVAGGLAIFSDLSSVEILDEGSNEWKAGPELPLGIYNSEMVEDQNGGVVLIGGMLSSFEALDTLYQLPHGGQDAVWTKMEQKLRSGRNGPTAFLVPDNSVDCS